MTAAPAPALELETPPCNLCGAQDEEPLFEALDGWPASAEADYAATTDRYGAFGRVVRCRRCELVYTSPRVKAGRILQEYAAASDEPYLEQRDARAINAHLALAALRRHAPKGRLLEVGCSAGFFLSAARLTYDVCGVEPSAWARRYAREQLKLDVPAATLEEAAFPDASFDVVASIDVIEHLADPAAHLRHAARLLKPGGVLYLVTPDIESLSAKVLRSRWWGLRPAHIYYFSRLTMRRLLEREGFTVVESGSYGRIFSYEYWLSRLVNYPPFVYQTAEAIIETLGIRRKFLYLDTRDSMQLVARKRS